ncbi:hypothetical protein AVEN_183697-1 [Araneus ventricosus]|uniref:Uncharacterized protein n=1 Tax=Araneus ventricosus TaxID=182803 RepID=A0A4Y2SI81_ARAVE|nr:hypothetical protein AVEN_183697-1 [Araneus ventricosus]
MGIFHSPSMPVVSIDEIVALRICLVGKSVVYYIDIADIKLLQRVLNDVCSTKRLPGLNLGWKQVYLVGDVIYILFHLKLQNMNGNPEPLFYHL